MRLSLLLTTLLAAASALACNDVEPAPPASTTDDQTLAAPATKDEGFQLATNLFEVPAGQEVQRCFFFEVPYDDATYVNRIQDLQRIGSHHMNVFRVRSIVNLSGKDGDIVDGGECWKSNNWSDWPLVINNQEGDDTVDWTLPEGVAHKFEPHELLMLQIHYVNATTQATPAGAQAFVNLYKTPAASVTAEVGTAFATNQSIQVCPGDPVDSFEATCKMAPQHPVTIIGANGHFHSRGIKFTIGTIDAQGNDMGGAPFYTNTRWNDPLMDHGLDISVPQGGGIRYTCDFFAQPNECGDPANMCCFTFGPKVETNEHCNAFVYYYPKNDSDQNCF